MECHQAGTHLRCVQCIVWLPWQRKIVGWFGKPYLPDQGVTRQRIKRDATLSVSAHLMRLRFLVLAVLLPLTGVCFAQNADMPAADSSSLDFKQWGLLAIQDGGRRKPVDTFAKEALIRITGRSTYTDKTRRTWRPNDFVLSTLVETHDWKNEPMVLISSGQLIEQLGLDKTQRR